MDRHLPAVIEVEHHSFEQSVSRAIPAKIGHLNKALIVFFVEDGQCVLHDVLDVFAVDSMLAGRLANLQHEYCTTKNPCSRNGPQR